MEPHQKHYRAKQQKRGWMDEADKMIWPQDVEACQKMARGLFGCELVSRMDNWMLIAEDQLDDTYLAPWASPDKKPLPGVAPRREILRTLNPEQREGVRELLRHAIKGELFSILTAFDQTLGGSTISIAKPEDSHCGRLEIHSADQPELHDELHQWLEDFSIIFGEDERYEAEA
jgi:hypothetical protein